MVYRRFENIEELLISKTKNRATNVLTSRDFKQREHNCNVANEYENGEFIFKGQCRTCCVTHELQCKICKKKCIGQMQQHLKKRRTDYKNDAVKLKNRGNHSDSFANNFVKKIK